VSEGVVVAEDATEGVVVAGNAAEGDAVAGDPAQGIDEDADQGDVNALPTWFLAPRSYEYGNFDLSWIHINGEGSNNAPPQFQNWRQLITYPRLWRYVFCEEYL
jgi:hypothetical protein